MSRSEQDWKAWWDEAGRPSFEQAAREPPSPPPPAAGQSSDEPLKTQVREERIRRFTSELRKHGADLYFVVDVTMSMTEELDRMRRQVKEITSFMSLLLPKGKVRLGYVTYGDDVVKRVPLTDKLPRFARAVEQIEIFNDPNDRTIEEGVSKALEDALAGDNRTRWSRKGLKTLLLLGDAPSLQPKRCRELAEQAKSLGITLNTLIAPCPPKYKHKPAEPEFVELARLGGGEAAKLGSPEELITQIISLAFGGQERDLRRFVSAYRDVTR